MAGSKSLNPFHHSSKPNPQLDIPSEPPPSYDDAVASGSSPRPAAAQPSSPASQQPTSPLPQQHPQSPLPQSPLPQEQPQHLPSYRQSLPTVARQFPPSFNIYTLGWGARAFSLAEHQSSPFYSIALHTGWSGDPPVVLHAGPNPDASPLMAAVDFGSFQSGMTITLPPMLNNPRSAEVPVDSDFGWSRTYRFRIETGLPGSERLEAFEWRHSYGEAIAAMGGTRDGWKLVRMANTSPPGLNAGEFRPGGAMTSDGREVVAVWTDAMMSMTKVAKFAFMGTGEVGVLGERWSTMAVMTALGIWERERRARNRRRH